MRAYDILDRKKRGLELTGEEIGFLIRGYTDGSVPDYQMAAFAMAVCLRGMTDAETAALTGAMAASGRQADLSCLGDGTVDKHSTGGVGDKTTLIAAPLAAAAGAMVAKMSGRGLGHTGGTIDKLESFPGLRTALTADRFVSLCRKTGLCIAGQSDDLAPADGKLYALRDVTATVDSVPLIASSVMSKKLAAGTRSIVLDVKCGSGAFCTTEEQARDLARIMVHIGHAHGRRMLALITDMDRPLGRAVGGSAEVAEAVRVLSDNAPDASDLRELSLSLAAGMTALALNLPRGQARARVEEALRSGAGLARLCRMVEAQGGDPELVRHPERFPKAAHTVDIPAPADGWIGAMDTREIGNAVVLAGGGRMRKQDTVDHAAGLYLHRKTGEQVRRGEPIATLYTNRDPAEAVARFLGAVTLTDTPPAPRPLIFGEVS